MALTSQTLTRIVYLRNIFEYITDNPKEFIELMLVNSSWQESIEEYSEETWKRIDKNYKKNGEKMLHLIAEKGSLRMMRICLTYGMDKEARNLFSWTPLHYACI